MVKKEKDPFTILADIIFTARKERNPLPLIRYLLQSNLWEIQEFIACSVFQNAKTTVKSCHAAGKSHTAAAIVVAFLLTFENSIVITSAPTFRQVKEVLWREIHAVVNRAIFPLGGKLDMVKYELGPNWYSLGMSSDKPDNFQGIHAVSGDILVVADEAPGISPQILEVMHALLTSEGAHLLYIGNPTSPSGPFYQSFIDNSFHKFTIPAFKTPNFTANGIHSVADLKKYKTEEEFRDLSPEDKKKFKSVEELKAFVLPRPYLITPLWAWERMQDWGEDSPMFISRVCADFPSESESTLIPLWMIDQCLAYEPSKEEMAASHYVKSIGIDVARFGGDTTVVTCFDKLQHVATRSHNGKDTMQTVGMAISMFKEYGLVKQKDVFVVDDTGVGGGVSDRLVELGYAVMKINFGESSVDERFVNLKAELFWNLRDLMQKKVINIKDDGKLIEQLPTLEYKYNSQGKLLIVSKEDMKKRGIKSPDFADSLALAVYGRTGGAIKIEATKSAIPSHQMLGGNLMDRTF